MLTIGIKLPTEVDEPADSSFWMVLDPCHPRTKVNSMKAQIPWVFYTLVTSKPRTTSDMKGVLKKCIQWLYKWIMNQMSIRAQRERQRLSILRKNK